MNSSVQNLLGGPKQGRYQGAMGKEVTAARHGMLKLEENEIICAASYGLSKLKKVRGCPHRRQAVVAQHKGPKPKCRVKRRSGVE